MKNGAVELLDCTVRDGGYLNNWSFEKKIVRELYRSLSKAGIDYVEIGYRGSEKYFDPKTHGIWRFSREEDIAEVTSGISGAMIAVMADFGRSDITEFAAKKESRIDLVRVAVHKDHIEDAVSYAGQIKEKGYAISLNLMGYSGYSDKERRETAVMLKDSAVDYVYVADSYGALFPDQVKEILGPLLDIGRFTVGFHPHNNVQMAFANTLAAIESGVRVIDGSIYGMGRGAGNLPLEAMLSYLSMKNGDRYNVIPVLNVIDKYFVEWQRTTPWGYQLPYMLSGVFKCHPDYAKHLVSRKEYTIEEIWMILEAIRASDPVGFSRELLDAVLRRGVWGHHAVRTSTPGKTTDSPETKPAVPYIDRHKGKDFLILANGPSLKDYQTQIDVFIAKYRPIVMGANYVGGLFVPTYHAFNNERRFMDYGEQVSPESRLLIGQYIHEDVIKEYVRREYERLYYVDSMDATFDIVEGIIQANCRTISVFLTGVAIVMGAGRIFIAGLDGYLGVHSGKGSHFYQEQEMEEQEMLCEKHEGNLRYLTEIDEYLSRRDKEGIHILTPTGYRTFYKGIQNYI